MNLLFTNIKELVQVRETSIDFLSGKEMNILPTIKNAFLLVENGLISDFGIMKNCPKTKFKTIDATGKLVLPSWCDSHTHLVYADSREDEFVDRINGLSYEKIAENGGGILNSAKKITGNFRKRFNIIKVKFVWRNNKSRNWSCRNQIWIRIS